MNKHLDLDLHPSSVWEKINNTILNTNTMSTDKYSNFRKVDSINSKITTWNPYEPSLRYFKTMLYNIVSKESNNFFKRYNQITNADMDSPIFIQYQNVKYNLDYILATYEIIFMKPYIDTINTICEIGAGFGRTCHSILETHNNIDCYYIIDLPNCLGLSKYYLQKTLHPNLYNKCKFMSIHEIDIPNEVDMFINIDSFAEMPPRTIKNYLKLISTHGKFLYCKNPIGKYNVEDIGLINPNVEDVTEILKTGLCRQSLDIYNDIELVYNLKIYVDKYKPNNNSKAVKFSNDVVFPHYGNVIYKII